MSENKQLVVLFIEELDPRLEALLAAFEPVPYCCPVHTGTTINIIDGSCAMCDADAAQHAINRLDAMFASVVHTPEGIYGQAADGWDDAFLPRPIEGDRIA